MKIKKTCVFFDVKKEDGKEIKQCYAIDKRTKKIVNVTNIVIPEKIIFKCTFIAIIIAGTRNLIIQPNLIWLSIILLGGFIFAIVAWDKIVETQGVPVEMTISEVEETYNKKGVKKIVKSGIIISLVFLIFIIIFAILPYALNYGGLLLACGGLMTSVTFLIIGIVDTKNKSALKVLKKKDLPYRKAEEEE